MNCEEKTWIYKHTENFSKHEVTAVWSRQRLPHHGEDSMLGMRSKTDRLPHRFKDCCEIDFKVKRIKRQHSSETQAHYAEFQKSCTVSKRQRLKQEGPRLTLTRNANWKFA